ncbi:MAG: hypothetical protein Q4D38_01395 [Planctomycetia bacterium]|nr:hypothetical protein [Planctomycetia bacterium]
MKKHCVGILFWCILTTIVCAQTPTKYVSVVKLPDGEPILRLEYPCEIHQKTSLEVRILHNETKENLSQTKPLYFEHDWLKLYDARGIQVQDELAHCFLSDDSDYVSRRMELFDPDAELTFLGWRNRFEKRESIVRVVMENPRIDKEETTLVYPDASRCCVGVPPSKEAPSNAVAYGYELIGTDFDAPCDLVVWLLRGKGVLVQEVVRWPGRKVAAPSKTKSVADKKKKNTKKSND